MSGDFFAVTVVLVVLIFTFAIVYILLKQLGKLRQLKKKLRDQGVSTTAEVLQRTSETDWTNDAEGNSRTDVYYYLTVHYKVGEASYQKRISVSRKTYNTVEEGTQVQVVYLPDQPEVVLLASQL